MRNILRVGAGLVLAGADRHRRHGAAERPADGLHLAAERPDRQGGRGVQQGASEGPGLALSLRHHRGDEPAAGGIRRRPPAGRRGAGRRRGRHHAAQERRPAAHLCQGAGRQDAGGADRSRQDLLRHQADHHRHRHNTKLVSTRAGVVERPAGAGRRVEDHHGASALFRRRGHPCRHLRAAEGFRLAVFREAGAAAAPSPPRATAP